MHASPEGSVTIKITHTGLQIERTTIFSTRPQLAQTLFHGRTPDDASNAAGLIFSLCGKAQTFAAQACCAAAAGQHLADDILHQHTRAVMTEQALEHAWRLLLDWPRHHTGYLPDVDTLQILRHTSTDAAAFSAALADRLTTRLLGQPLQSWLALDLAGLTTWYETRHTMLQNLFADLPETDTGRYQGNRLPAVTSLHPDDLCDIGRQALQHPDFCRTPVWYGQPAETGAVTRMHNHPLLAEWVAQRGCGMGARMLARLLELAQMPARLASQDDTLLQSHALENHTGVAAAETARGMLIHAVQLQNERVLQYRIIAPTEWNFHPAGPVTQALGTLSPGTCLQQQAMLVCQAFDPCVAFTIEVKHA